MNIFRDSAKLILLLLPFVLLSQNHDQSIRSEYYAHLPFWESPYQPFKLASPITKVEAKKRIHAQVDYDVNNRVIATHIKIGNHYKDYEGFLGNIYINAPLTRVNYEGEKERHSFYDRFGNRIKVQGNVYQKVYSKDEYGRNTELIFLDSEGNETVDQIGVKSYKWIHQNDGSIIEERLDKEGVIVPLRGYFDLERTRMIFDNQGYFGTLQNVDQKGNIINTKNGVAVFNYYYDQQGRFDKWEVYDDNGKKAIGPSNTAGEKNTHYQYNLEDIIFFDTKENPATHWSGAERWHFEVDKYGNNLFLEFQDNTGNPMNAKNGYSKFTWEWSKDGRFLITEAYFDKDGVPTVHKQLGIHKLVYKRNKKGSITSRTYYNVNGNIANRKDGIAIIRISYDKNNMEIKREYYDKNEKKLDK